MSAYKELPCRRCGQLWKWALDKKSTPYCPEGYGCSEEGPTIPEHFEEVFKKLDEAGEKEASLQREASNILKEKNLNFKKNLGD